MQESQRYSILPLMSALVRTDSIGKSSYSRARVGFAMFLCVRAVEAARIEITFGREEIMQWAVFMESFDIIRPRSTGLLGSSCLENFPHLLRNNIPGLISFDQDLVNTFRSIEGIFTCHSLPFLAGRLLAFVIRCRIHRSRHLNHLPCFTRCYLLHSLISTILRSNASNAWIRGLQGQFRVGTAHLCWSRRPQGTLICEPKCAHQWKGSLIVEAKMNKMKTWLVYTTSFEVSQISSYITCGRV